MFQTVDLPSFVTAGSLLLALMALTTWAMLRRSAWSRAAGLWSLGGLGISAGIALIALRGRVPELLSLQLANVLIFTAFLVRTQALRRDLGRPWSGTTLMALWLLPCAVYIALCMLEQTIWRLAWALFIDMLGCAALAWHARAIGRHELAPSATVLAWAEACSALALTVRLLSVLGGHGARTPLGNSWDVVMLFSVFFVTSIYANLAYLALALDRTRAAADQATTLELAERVRMEAAEAHTRSLEDLLAERQHLATERDHLLRVLAHEVRQPLHHASGALQAASMALDTAEPVLLDRAEYRLLRAQTVLGEVQAVLDNTLTASEMLTRQHAAARDDCELGVLVALALGDLPLEQRQRVQLLWETPVRTVSLDPVLTRLALRNLLRNALSHGGAAAQVILRVGESDHPAAMRLTVEDDGPGLAAAHLQTTPETAWPAEDQGMGLFIVRRVMALHGGRLLLSARAPRGLRATLEFPEPA